MQKLSAKFTSNPGCKYNHVFIIADQFSVLFEMNKMTHCLLKTIK